MTETIKVELEFLEWLGKIAERINTVHFCMVDKRKMLEKDYEILERLHDVFWDGAIPIYKTVASMTDDPAEQANLFSQNVSTTLPGDDKESEKK